MRNGFIWFCYFVRLRPPAYRNLDEYLDFLIPKVRYFGEDLAEEHFYIRKRWLEFNPNSKDVVLNIFEPVMKPNQLSGGAGADLMRVRNGDVSMGAWSYLAGNKMTIQHEGQHQQLYDLGFLNDYIFVIRKHGSNQLSNKSNYIVLVSEGGIRSIMGRALGTSEVSVETIAELLYHYYYFNNFITGFIILGVPIFVLLLYFLF